jgi:hypothetical protein
MRYWSIQVKSFGICRDGITFPRKGDVLFYRWPWLSGNRWVSLKLEAGFETLKEYDRCHMVIENVHYRVGVDLCE